MSGLQGQLDQSFKATWVSNSGSVGRGVTDKELAPEQIAVFPADIDCAVEDVPSLTTPSFKKNKRLVIKQGLHPFSGQLNPFLSRQTKHNRETIEFTADDIVSWTGLKGEKGSATQVIALGYDGFDASKSLNNIKLDAKPLTVNIRLSGAPIKRFFHRNFIDHRFVIDKNLCVGDCECFDACDQVPCDHIADGIIKHINETELFNEIGGRMFRFPLRNLLKANKIKKCTEPDEVQDKTEYQKWTISVCDDGRTTIGKLSALNPGMKIVRESRVDGVTTYAAWLPADAPAPVNYTPERHLQPVCDECPTCPEDSETIPGLKVVQATVACGAAAPTVPGEVESTLMSSTLRGGDVYIVNVSLDTTDEAIETALDAASCLEYAIIGVEGKQCVVEGCEAVWAQCENCFKIEKELKITLPDLECEKGESRLEELQAAYPSLVIEEDQRGECMGSYKTTIQSNCVPEEDCGKLVSYEFGSLPAYDGAYWVDYTPTITEPDCEVPAPPVEPCCVCGVILETAFYDRQFQECQYGWNNYFPDDVKPVKVQINIHSTDITGNPCDETPHYATQLQGIKLDRGATGVVVQEYEREFLGYERKVWDTNPYKNEIEGFIPVAKQHLLYDTYTLRLKRNTYYGHTHFMKDQTTTDYVFYIPSGEGKEFEAFMNELVLSAGNPELRAVAL